MLWFCGPHTVRLSVQHKSEFYQKAKLRITETTPHNNQGTQIFRCKRSWRNSIGVTHNMGAKQTYRCSILNRCFRLISRYTSETVQDTEIVTREGQQEYLCTLLNGAISKDTEGLYLPQTIPFMTFSTIGIAFCIFVNGGDKDFKFGT